MLSFLELAEEDCFGPVYVFHPCDMASPAQLRLLQDGLYAGQAGSLEDLFIGHLVLPFDAKNEAQRALVKPFKQPDLLLIQNQGLCTVQEGGNDDSPVYLDLCREALYHTSYINEALQTLLTDLFFKLDITSL